MQAERKCNLPSGPNPIHSWLIFLIAYRPGVDIQRGRPSPRLQEVHILSDDGQRYLGGQRHKRRHSTLHYLSPFEFERKAV